MQENNTGKIITHIEEAENWLDEAKGEFKRANPIRGEMILNMAQAEIKYAWELSRKRDVSIPEKISLVRKPVFWLPAAASILLIPFLAMFLWHISGTDSSDQSANLMAVRSADPPVMGSLVTPETHREKVMESIALRQENEVTTVARVNPEILTDNPVTKVDQSSPKLSKSPVSNKTTPAGILAGQPTPDPVTDNLRPGPSRVPVAVTGQETTQNLLGQDWHENATGDLLRAAESSPVPETSGVQPVLQVTSDGRTTSKDSDGSSRINH